MNRKKHARALKTKILILILLIIVVLNVILMVVFQWSRQAVTTRMYDVAVSNLAYQHDQYVDNISRIQYQLQCLTQSTIVSKYLTYANTSSPANRYSMQIEMLNTMKTICNSHASISSLELYYITLRCVFTVGKKSSSSMDMLSDDELEMLLGEHEAKGGVLLHGNELSVEYKVPVNSHSDEWPIYFLRVELSEDYLKQLMSSFEGYGTIGSYMLLQDSEKLYASDDSKQAFLLAVQNVAFEANEGISQMHLKVENKGYTTVSLYDAKLKCWFVQILDDEAIYYIPNRMMVFLYLFLALSVVLAPVYMSVMHRMVNRPIKDLLTAFDNIYIAEQTPLQENYSKEFNTLAVNFNAMSDRLHRLISQVYEQRLLLRTSQLKQLQSQINPHFLYNSFYLLQHLIQFEDMENAELLSGYLGEYFQYITSISKDIIPFEVEYAHAITYLNIQQMRFQERLQVDAQPLPEEIRRVRVLRLILQPILENSLKYANQNSGAMQISIAFRQEENGLFSVAVEDNGTGLTNDKIKSIQADMAKPRHEDHALYNIRRRLQIFYDDENCNLTVSRAVLGGLRVCLTMKRKGESHE